MHINQLLSEKLLQGEFKFGFELEGILSDRETYNALNSFISHKIVIQYLTKQFAKYIPEPGKFQSDESIEDQYEYDYPFEWASPVFDFTPANISNVIKLLNGIKDIGIVTNKSCGFHVHISFPTLTELDAFWLMCKLSLDPVMKKQLKYFKSYRFFQPTYADQTYLEALADTIKSEDWHSLKSYFTDDKYRILRIHPQGTLEWRGPRDFLRSKNPETIREFFLLLISFVRWISNTLTERTIGNHTREKFNQILKDHNAHMSFDKGKRRSDKFSEAMTGDDIRKVLEVAPWLKKATFKNGIIKRLTDNTVSWIDGEWIDGEWFGELWVNGTWHNGTWHRGMWQSGTWLNGNWLDGDWLNGRWRDGTWHNGKWKDGDWSGGTWHNGTWKYGDWSLGIWNGGTWQSGTWYSGTWNDGTWLGGFWYDGEWNGGEWKRGAWGIGRIKNRNGKLVKTKLDPSSFYKKQRKK